MDSRDGSCQAVARAFRSIATGYLYHFNVDMQLAQNNIYLNIHIKCRRTISRVGSFIYHPSKYASSE